MGHRLLSHHHPSTQIGNLFHKNITAISRIFMSWFYEIVKKPKMIAAWLCGHLCTGHPRRVFEKREGFSLWSRNRWPWMPCAIPPVTMVQTFPCYSSANNLNEKIFFPLSTLHQLEVMEWSWNTCGACDDGVVALKRLTVVGFDEDITTLSFSS